MSDTPKWRKLYEPDDGNEDALTPPPRDGSAARRQKSVYPGRDAERVLGGAGSALYNRAIQCFARLLAQATLDNDAAFDRAAWAVLGDVLAQKHPPDPDLACPAAELAAFLDLLAAECPAARRLWKAERRERARALADHVRRLDYVHAWAVVFSVEYRAKAREADTEWWSLKSRYDFD